MEGGEMTVIRLRTLDLPAQHRFAFWHETTNQAHVPMAVDSYHRNDFRATAEVHDLGVMQLSRLTYPPLRARRTERLIRQSDPELLLVSHVPRGRMVSLFGRDELTGDRDSVIVYDTSRPTTVTNDVAVTNVFLQLPRSALDPKGTRAERLLASPIPTTHGIGAVLAFVLDDLAKHGDTHPPAVTAQLTATVLELLAAAGRIASGSGVGLSAGSRMWIRQTQIQAYIRRRLADPTLTPSAIAEAHGLSVRQLHRVFQADGATPSGWIRRQRLEHCRRDLADPDLATRSVVAIGARWGFPDPAAFNRAFRREFGLPPGEYRRQFTGTETADHGL
jgi:AraC-like DNA-binding protein